VPDQNSLGREQQIVALRNPQLLSMRRRCMPGLALLAATFAAPCILAQSPAPEARPQSSPRAPDSTLPSSTSAPQVHPLNANPLAPAPKSPVHFRKTQFVILSAAVYGAALADMHESQGLHASQGWYETDPLAKPFDGLPAPAYYASGLAAATGLNWVCWKMAHSRRWHRLAPIPQLLAISGNAWGYESTRAQTGGSAGKPAYRRRAK